MKVILGTTSKNRQDIMKMIGLKYEVVTSLVEEKSNAVEPDKYVEELSLQKAESVASQVNEKAIIITVDGIIYKDGKKYEKPKSREEAIKNMRELSGNTNVAWTGMTIMDLYQNKNITFSVGTEVKFREMTDEEIAWYVDRESRVYNCCGYAVLGKAAIFIEGVNGDYNSLFGISPNMLFVKLKELGYSIEDFEFEDNIVK